MFLPVDVFHHLFAVLAGRPTVAASTSGDVHVVESVDEPAVLKAIIHAACAARAHQSSNLCPVCLRLERSFYGPFHRAWMGTCRG